MCVCVCETSEQMQNFFLTGIVDIVLDAVLSLDAVGQWISFHSLPNEDADLRLSYRDWSPRRTYKAFQFLDMGCG